MTTALDTNVAVDLLRGGTGSVRRRFENASTDGAHLVVSLVVFHELMYGAACSARPAEHRANVTSLLRGIAVEELNQADAISAADVRARLRARGPGIGPYDALIAGQALNRGWTLVTANVREFGRIEGLQVEDWSK